MAVGALALGALALIVGAVGWYKADSASRLAAERDDTVVEAMATELASLRDARSQSEARYAALEDQYKGLVADYQSITAAVNGRVDEVAAQLAAAEQRLADQLSEHKVSLDSTLAAERETQQAEIQGFRSEFGQLSDSVRFAQSNLGESVEHWSLNEVEQLLMLANQRVQLAGDARSAGTALQLADARLAEIDDPALTDIRRTIAEESASLAAVEQVDVAGLALRLAALSDQVDSLPLPKKGRTLPSPGTAQRATGAPAEQSQWKAAAKRLWADMSKLVTVRRVDETQAPMLPAEYQYLLHENLRLMLNSAQLALLRGSQELYTEHLSAASTWVDAHFDTALESVQQFRAALEETAAAQIRSELPDISSSLTALRALIQSRSAS